MKHLVDGGITTGWSCEEPSSTVARIYFEGDYICTAILFPADDECGQDCWCVKDLSSYIDAQGMNDLSHILCNLEQGAGSE